MKGEVEKEKRIFFDKYKHQTEELHFCVVLSCLVSVIIKFRNMSSYYSVIWLVFQENYFVASSDIFRSKWWKIFRIFINFYCLVVDFISSSLLLIFLTYQLNYFHVDLIWNKWLFCCKHYELFYIFVTKRWNKSVIHLNK